MPPLTKSAYLLGRHCPLRLWLWAHGVPERAEDEVDPVQDFVTESALVERHAYGLFPGLRFVDEPRKDDEPEEDRPGLPERLRRTRAWIADASVPAIGQAFLSAGGLLGAVDILVRSGSGWELVEVKASKHVHSLHHHDLAFQWALAEAAGLIVTGASVVLLDGDYEHAGGAPSPDELLCRVDVTEIVRSLLPSTRAEIERLLGVMRGPEPAVTPTSRCRGSRGNAEGDRPSDCGHLSKDGRCGSRLPRLWVWRLPKVTAARKRRLLESMPDPVITALDPEDPVRWTEDQKRVIRASQTGRPEIDRDALRAELDRIEYPVAYVDFEFETGMAVPRFEGTRPYDKIPFQWSMHVQRERNAPLQQPAPFLHLDASDPRMGFIESLLEALPQSGSIVAHHVGAEKSVLGQYRRWLDGRFGPAVDALVPRLRDTEKIAFAGYYHPDQLGSYSLKALAPALLGWGYDDLEVQGGMAAVRAWRRVVSGEAAGSERERIEADLLDYCARDTVLLHEVLTELRRLAPES